MYAAQAPPHPPCLLFYTASKERSDTCKTAAKRRLCREGVCVLGCLARARALEGCHSMSRVSHDRDTSMHSRRQVFDDVHPHVLLISTRSSKVSRSLSMCLNGALHSAPGTGRMQSPSSGSCTMDGSGLWATRAMSTWMLLAETLMYLPFDTGYDVITCLSPTTTRVW